MKEERENEMVELWGKGEEGEWLPCHDRFGGEEEEPWTALLLFGFSGQQGRRKKKKQREGGTAVGPHAWHMLEFK